MKRVITFGTFDLLHVGHVRILGRARQLGDYLVLGISSDQLSYQKKGRLPVHNQHDRFEIVSSIRYVDEVFLEESLELKKEYIKRYRGDILVMGDDWQGKFDECGDLCDVVYLSRTEGISTTAIVNGKINVPS